MFDFAGDIYSLFLFEIFGGIISILLAIIIGTIINSSNKSNTIKQQAKEVVERNARRPELIKEFGTYLSTFPIWEKVYHSDLKEKFEHYEQPLPDIFELNDFLHTINCEAAFANDYYMMVPIGTIDFEEKRKFLNIKQ